ncbi:MAG: hypothetical protein ACLP8A_01135 [Methylovirgula sp.]
MIGAMARISILLLLNCGWKLASLEELRTLYRAAKSIFRVPPDVVAYCAIFTTPIGTAGKRILINNYLILR